VNRSEVPEPKAAGPKTAGSKVLGVIGLLVYLVVGFFPYSVSGLTVPGPWLFILWGIWVVGLVLAWRTYRTHPAMVLLYAPAALVFWFIYITAGENLLGWTA